MTTRRLRRLGAPGRRPAAPRRPRRLGGRADRRGRPGPRRAPLRRRRDHPGHRQRPLAPRVRGLRGLRRRAAVRAAGSERTSRASARSRSRRWWRSRAAASPTRSPPGSRRRPTTASRARPRRRRPSSGCARPSTSRSSGATRRRPSRQFRSCARGRRRAELVRIGISPHAPYTCSLEVYRWCLSLGIPVGTHLAESAAENEWLEHGSGPMAANARRPRPADRQAQRGDARRRARPRASVRPLRRGRRRRDRAARPARRPGRPLPALERTARLRHRAARRAPRRRGCASGSGPTRPPRRPPSTPGRSCARRSTAAAPASGAPTRSTRPTRCASRRSTAARALGLDHELGSLAPGKRADLTIVSIGGSPYDPVEDPAVAAVFGGSPGGRARDDRRRTDPLPPRRDRVARGTQHRKRRPRSNARVASAPREGEAEAASSRAGRTSSSSTGCAATRSGCSCCSSSCSRSASSSSASAPARPASPTCCRTSSAARAAAARRSPPSRRRRSSTRRTPRPGAIWRPSSSRTARDDEAITALTSYIGLKPKDQDALRELAAVDLRRAQALSDALPRGAGAQPGPLADADVPARRPARSSARRSLAAEPGRAGDLDRRRAPARTTPTPSSRPTSASASTPTRSSSRSTRRTRRRSSTWRRPRRTPATPRPRSRPYKKFLKLAPAGLARTVRAEAAEAAQGLGRRIRIDRRDDVGRLTDYDFSDRRFHLHRRRPRLDSPSAGPESVPFR